MTITYGFFNSINGDRKYNAAQIGRYLQYIVGSGVFPYVSTSLQVLANDGMTVEVQAGRAMLDHHYLDNDAPITLTLTAGGTQDRVDAIIMYVDMTERACGITIKEGTPAASPVPPAMTRTDVRKEYMLAKVRVAKLSSSITQSSITDTRPDSTVCGWVAGLINQVDTSTLFLQWQTAYEEALAKTQDYLAAQQAAWEAFFDSVTHDNVLPAPALSQAGYVVTVNETGDGYELRPGVATDKTLAVQGAAADAAAVGRALTTPNLLVNSDFTNPVNTGGKTTYNTANADTIDCWYQLKATNVSIGANGITLTASTATPTTGLLSQKVPGIPSGKTYTFALKDTDGNVYILSRVLDSDIDSFVNVGNSVYMRAISVDGNGVVTIGLYEGSKTFVWAALYEGEYTAETLPLYRPRGYALEAVICGGGGLNFKVVGGTTQPSNPSENTIWVNTSATITSWIFSATEPTNPTEGMAWISTGASSPVGFNTLKKNCVMIYPLSAKQYVSGAWVDVTAKSYQNGAWVDWMPEGALFYHGDQIVDVTGGWQFTNYDGWAFESAYGNTDGGLSVTIPTSGNRGGTFTTKNKVVKGNYTKLCVLLSNYDNTSGSFKVIVGVPSQNTSPNISGHFTITNNPTGNGVHKVDISKASASFYVACGATGLGGVTFEEVWLE